MSRGRRVPLHDEGTQDVARLSRLLGMLQAAEASCVRATGYEHRYCCTVHANAGADHGDFPPDTTRCRAWPRAADATPHPRFAHPYQEEE